MARAWFGGGVADFVVSAAAPGDPLRFAAATLTMWDAETGGTQVTDLLLGGVAVTTIPVGVSGAVPSFQGPDGVYALWADGGSGRSRLDAVGSIVEAAGGVTDGLMTAVANDPTSDFVAVQTASIAGKVEADDFSPVGAWDFTQAPTVGGQPIAADVPTASTTTAGKVELATTAETTTGTDATRAVTPAGLAAQKGAASGIAPLDAASRLPDANTPARLGIAATTVASADDAILNGWYRVTQSAGANLPDAVNTFSIFVSTAATDSGYVTQLAHAHGADSSADTLTYRRERNNSVWGAWYRIRQSQAELDTRYLVSAASDTVAGKVELATTAETTTGTDATRAVTPAGAAATYQPISFSKAFTTPYSGVEPVQNIQITSKNTGTVAQRRTAYRAQVSDAPGVNQINVTGATNASPIVITATGHGYATGDRVTVQDVTGNTAANGIWTITVLTANTFSLNGSTGNGAFVAGGYVTNRSMLTGMVIEIGCSVTRGGLTGAATNGDDACGVSVDNMGAGRATDAYYVSANGGGWVTAFSTDANAVIAMRAGGTSSIAAAELCGPLLLGAPGGAFGAGDVRLRRTAAKELTFDDGAGGAVQPVFNMATSNTATAGANGAPPASVQGYLKFKNQFGWCYVPYYNA